MGKRTAIAFLCCMLAISAWLLVKPTAVHACSCAGPSPVQDDLNRKTAIFAGKVKSVDKPRGGLIRSSADPVEVTFEVTDVWKGELRSETKVYTAMSGASCGYEGFAAGQSYIVFAHGLSDRLETGSCERTKLLASASEELAALGAGYKPTGSLESDGDNNRAVWGTVLAGAALAIAAVGLAVSFKRMRRSDDSQ
ncbi:hypothetical protein [Paenibacillus hemerocallicola]|uniref:hypothetical protein n=1 Tax=Paenibacillus hemerocallicola TaxID=1172614 RepID=UPI00159EC22E|nr:hypothetical protein [Paenibacillus hemerocallicola]